MNKNNFTTILFLSAAPVGLCCCQNADENVQGMDEAATVGTIAPQITVSEQMVEGNQTLGQVVIDEAISDGPGWLVIHNNLFGKPGGVIGYTHVNNGTNSDVAVTIHSFVATDNLFAVLHLDRGQANVFEYPDTDVEQKANGQIVIMPFAVRAEGFSLMNLTEMAG